MNNIDVAPYTAVVTGGASGIGAATVAGLRARGVPVVAVDLAWPSASTDDADLVNVTGDVAASTTWTGVLKACEDLGGPPSKLVINAARLVVGTVLDITEEDLRGVLEVNVLGAYHALRACLPGMIARGDGSIVTVASVDALVAEQSLAAYCASKGALLQLTRCIAIDHALDGIRANCVCPGAVDTPFLRRHVDAAPDPPAFLQEKADRHPRGRILQPTEIANVIQFLLSEASSGINGAAIPVDAGLLACFDFQPSKNGALCNLWSPTDRTAQHSTHTSSRRTRTDRRTEPATPRFCQDVGHDATCADPREPIWHDGPQLFEFLLEADFAGPERTEGGIAYHRPGLHIGVYFHAGHEPEVATTVTHISPDGTRTASLDCLYVACQCGVLQDVPGNAPNHPTAAIRVRQHADALRHVLPHLLADDADQLIRRCQGRLLPEP